MFRLACHEMERLARASGYLIIDNRTPVSPWITNAMRSKVH